MPKESTSPMPTTDTQGLLHTVWRRKKTSKTYRVTLVDEKRADVYLSTLTKGGRSTWKAICLLPYDYERIPTPTDANPTAQHSR